MVLGGTSAARTAIARAFHRASPLSRGPFLSLDCARDEPVLWRALQQWLMPAGAHAEADPLGAIRGGMLFLDHVESLAPRSQRLLLMLSRRLQDEPGMATAWPAPARLAAGSAEDLSGTAGRWFSRDLFDCLDKIRVELPWESPLRGPAASARVRSAVIIPTSRQAPDR